MDFFQKANISKQKLIFLGKVANVNFRIGSKVNFGCF
jgi:hypothetical protein